MIRQLQDIKPTSTFHGVGSKFVLLSTNESVNVPHNAFSYENIVYTLRQNLKT